MANSESFSKLTFSPIRLDTQSMTTADRVPICASVVLLSLWIACASTLAAPAMAKDEVSTNSGIALPWNLVFGLDAGSLYQIPQKEKVLFSNINASDVFKTLCDVLAYTDLLSDADNTSDLLRILEENVQSACLWFKNVTSVPRNTMLTNSSDSYLNSSNTKAPDNSTCLPGDMPSNATVTNCNVTQNSSDTKAPDNSTCLPGDMDYFRLACAKTQLTVILGSARSTAVRYCTAFKNCPSIDHCKWVEQTFLDDVELVERIKNSTVGCNHS